MKRDFSLKAWRENINSPGGLTIEGREGEGGEYIVHYNKVHEVEQCLAVRFILVLYHCRIVVSKYFLCFSVKFTALLRGFSWW